MLPKIFDITFLLVGYLFTFLIPGMYFIETYFPKLPKRFKIPIYLLLSVMISAYLVYFVSIIIGFSRYSILVSFSFFIPWIIINFKKSVKTLFRIVKKYLLPIIFSLLVFLIYFISLFPGIFTPHRGFIVMSSSNWQDTAMHMGIIESISQGNFPPQAPYFSGVPLNYYYFTDFHSSILETLYGRFFPRVIVYDNPLFAMIFFLSVYLLTLEVTKNKIVSIFSGLASVFYGSFMYINFIKDVFNSPIQNKFAAGIKLLTTDSYAIEFGKFFQISPMADYFLQNRPMMVGLPAVVIVTALVIYIYKTKKYEWMILPGIITAMLLKFQFFAFIISIFIFGIVTILNFKFDHTKKIVKAIILFFILPLFFIIIFSSSSKINNQDILKVVVDNFSFTPWEEGMPLMWYIKFLVANLGLLIIFFVVAIPKLIKNKMLPLFFISTILLLIPLICKFTIMKYDMLKFYNFLAIFISIIFFWFLSKIIKNKVLFFAISIFVLVVTIPTSFTNLINSYLNKTIAYSMSELNSGYWIRDNTPQKSVFIDLANLHSPITEVAGRLRVLSYINWPHSHGYNTGFDNVFTRLDDIRNIYNDENKDLIFIKNILNKYSVNYIYLGTEEKNEFPNAGNKFDNIKFLNKVYSNSEVLIYEVVKNLPN